MDMMIPRIQFYHELANHPYFFEAPDYSTGFSPKFKKWVMTSKERVNKTLTDLAEWLNTIDKSDFKWTPFNKICSEYLAEQNQAGAEMKSEEVFFLLWYAITGNPVGAPVGEVIEVVGKTQTIERIESAWDHLNE